MAFLQIHLPGSVNTCAITYIIVLTATVSVVPTEGKNEAGNAAEEAETMADGTGSQLDQSSSQLAQAKEASCAEPTAMEQSESEELAYEGESDMEKNAGRVARGEREGTPLQDENGEREKASKEDSDSKEPDPVIDLHVSEAMEMMIDDDVASQEEKSSPPPEEVNDSKKEVEQPSASAEPDHELPIERFSSRYLPEQPSNHALCV